MVRSVEEILGTEFNRSLSDSGVHIIDPFVGTGNFIGADYARDSEDRPSGKVSVRTPLQRSDAAAVLHRSNEHRT